MKVWHIKSDVGSIVPKWFLHTLFEQFIDYYLLISLDIILGLE